MANTYHDQLNGTDLHDNKVYSATGSELSSWTPTDARYARQTRTLTTTSPLAGGGDLSADRTLSIPAATGLANGYLTSTDWATFNNKGAKSFYVIGPSGSTGNDVTCTGTADNATINTAVAAVSLVGGGTVFLKRGTYNISGRITSKSNVRVVGEGKGITKLTGGNTFDYTFYNATAISRFELHDLTIDCQNGTNASGLALLSASDCIIQNVEFKNVTNGWHFRLSVPNSATDGILNTNNKIIDCDFDTHAGTLEMLLLHNCRNTQVIRPRFFNKTTTGPTFGLWQKTYGTRIIDPQFTNVNGASFYYSVTCEYTWLVRPHFENAGGIQGANSSDNGNFGLIRAEGLKIIDPVFIGGTATISSTAIQLGAVNDVVVTNPCIEGYQIGIVFGQGNNSNSAVVTNWTVTNPLIKNSNPNNDFHVIHPGIYFSGIGGTMNGKLLLGNIYDDQTTKTQRYPISFSGAYTWNGIEVLGTRLAADTANGGTAYALANAAAIGSDVVFRNCLGLNPETLYVQGSITGTTTFNRLNGNVIAATLTNNITVVLTGGKAVDDTLTLQLTQDATGSRTVTWPANFKKAGGSLVLSTAANTVDVIVARWDGVNWVEVGRALNVS